MRRRRAALLGLASALIHLTPSPAVATDFRELRLTTGGAVRSGSDQYDFGIGGAFDFYADAKTGFRFGLDALLLGHPPDHDEPIDLAVAPDLAMYFARDGATFRPFVVLRPTFVLSRRGDESADGFARFEVGGEGELRSENGAWRTRLGLFWVPGRGFDDSSWNWAGAGLRLTVAWANPPNAPGGVECVFGEQGCE